MKASRGPLPRGAGGVKCLDCGAEARADGKGTPIVLKHDPACLLASEATSDEPLLGLATTRQLLEELRARGSAHRPGMSGRFMAKEAQSMLDILPEVVLRYRTVDS